MQVDPHRTFLPALSMAHQQSRVSKDVAACSTALLSMHVVLSRLAGMQLLHGMSMVHVGRLEWTVSITLLVQIVVAGFRYAACSFLKYAVTGNEHTWSLHGVSSRL